MIEKLAGLIAAKIAEILLPKLLAALPVIAAAVAKAVAEQVTKAIPSIPDVVADLPKLADSVRRELDKLIPDIDLPIIGDLTDFWRPK